MGRAASAVRWWRAYYALLFWEGLIDPPPAPICRRQSLFSVLLNAMRGLQLQTIADGDAQASLRDPINYGPNTSASGSASGQVVAGA